jgi:hypothetical protein
MADGANDDSGWKEKEKIRRPKSASSLRDSVSMPSEPPKLGPDSDPFGIEAERAAKKLAFEKKYGGKGGGGQGFGGLG